jgi:hypothetical protein
MSSEDDSAAYKKRKRSTVIDRVIQKMAIFKAGTRGSKNARSDGIKDLSVSGQVGGKTVSQEIEELNSTLRREKRKLRTGKS